MHVLTIYNQYGQDLKITINQLREEANEKDSSIMSSSIKFKQLQKQNKDLQYLVNKYKTLDASTDSQTDEVATYMYEFHN